MNKSKMDRAADIRNHNLKAMIDNDRENRFLDALNKFGIDNALKYIAKIQEENEKMDEEFIKELRNMEIEAQVEKEVMSDDEFLQKIAEMECELAGLKKISSEEKEIDSGKMDVRVDGFLLDVQNEFERASKKHKKFSSHHEGLAVIWEEFEELKEEIFKKVPDQDNLYDELTQIAAMCLKFYKNIMED